MTTFFRAKPVRLKGRAMAALRMAVYERDGAKCVECGSGVSYQGGGFRDMHLAHIKSRGAGGEDTMENTRCLCLWCHSKEHNAGGKPVPAKGRAA